MKKTLQFLNMNNKKITHVVAFGDSFVEGYIRNSPYEDNKKANEISFVNQLKDYSDYIKTSTNFGAHGDANQKICYDCFKWLRKNNFSNINREIKTFIKATKQKRINWLKMLLLDLKTVFRIK